MLKTLLLLMTFVSSFQSISSSCFGSDDEKNYGKLEKMMFNEENIKHLQDAFYPTNLHSSKTVSVSYDLVSNDAEIDEVNLAPPKICFYWLSSPVHLMINKEMLDGLSFRTYIPVQSSLTIPLNISELCPDNFEDVLQELSYINKLNNSTHDPCNGNVRLLAILNNFTTNLHLYALGENTLYTNHDHNIPLDKKGYSVYYYDPTMPTKYCVINYEGHYDNERLLLNIDSVLVIFFTLLGSPLLFVELYQPIINKLNDDSGSEYWRFVAWNVVIVSSLVNILVFNNNGYVLHVFHSQYDLTSSIFIFLITFSVICYGVWIINFFSCLTGIFYLSYDERFSKELPIPCLLAIICIPNNSSTQVNDEQDTLHVENGLQEEHAEEQLHEHVDPEAGCCGKKPPCRYSIAIALGCTIVVHFLQLLSFHIVYFIIGAIASPIDTLSVLCNYVMAYLFAVIYIAVILKYMNKVYFKDISKNRKKITYNIICCILPLLIGGLSLIASVCLFVTLFDQFTVVMEVTSQNEGVLGVVKSFLPSLFVTFLGFIGHKILKRIRRKKRKHSGSSSRETPCTQGYSSNSSRSTSSGSTSQTSSSSQEVSADANSLSSPSRAAITTSVTIEDPTDSCPNRNSSSDSSTKAAAKTTSRAGGKKKYSEETEPLITLA